MTARSHFPRIVDECPLKQENVECLKNASRRSISFMIQARKIAPGSDVMVNLTYGENKIYRRLIYKWYERFGEGNDCWKIVQVPEGQQHERMRTSELCLSLS